MTETELVCECENHRPYDSYNWIGPEDTQGQLNLEYELPSY